MAEESSRDLPLELLEKLRDLELELEDGDITQKGFEKKKAGLFERFGVSITANDSSSMAGHEVDLGPEPSAADVIDFLDYLPSPTHSPTRPTQGAHYMEENHRQHQDRLQDRPPPEQPYVNYPRSHTSPTQSYKSSPSLSTMQGVPPSSSSSSGPYGQSMRSGDSSMGYPPPPLPLLQTQPSFSSAYSQQPHPQQGPYYASLPNRPYDPRMNRPPYSQNAGSSSPMRHPTAPYGYPSPQRPPSNPPMNAYRPPSGSPNTAYPQRPMYNSPRPMHRPPAMNRPSSTYYRPPGQANPNGLIYADHRTENPSPHGNYRPPYGYNQRPPATTHTRHNSDHTAESVETSSRQSHGRNDSLVGRGQ
ncbi:hypothetical protein BDF14DRAFT_1744884 [Spinellus fusiger]|nr:hypothetical protein BDF14DRAFT_1744884 [Spinellus fusiger]